jgi:lipopolysaccharide biosynthesis glycosyltransferase
MNIVYSSSNTYSEICGISLLSLLENNKDVDAINIFIIDNGISAENKQKLTEVANLYHRMLSFKSPVDLQELTHTQIYVGRWNIGTFFRLYLGSILPQSVDRVMYFDCDMIIRHSLASIYSLDLKGCSVAGADDCRSDLYRINIGTKPGSTYINNGFILIDLQRWRQENVEEEFTKFINRYQGDITYMDQGVLNGVLGPKNEILEIDPIFNSQRIFFDFTYSELLALRKPEYHLSEKQYEAAVTDPVIVHFTPTFISGTRPWMVKDKHPFTKEYLYYKSLSPWKDVPLRKDDRKFAKKAMTVFCKILPRKLMIHIMSYFHSKWYPKKRIKIMNKALCKGSQR